MAKRSFSTRQEKFLKQKQNKNSWKKPSSCLVSRHLLPPSLFFTHNMNPSYRDPFLPLFDISISYHLCMLTTILRPSSVWCGKEKNSSFWNLQKKKQQKQTKTLLFINRVCMAALIHFHPIQILVSLCTDVKTYN